MRTKHVLMTTALLSLFAACTNDDFVSYEQGGQSGDAAKRPTVDVTLNVLEGNGADTRLSFIPGVGEGYQWQTNDTIGALLMDKVIANDGTKDIRPHDDIEKWEEMAWTSRYELVDYINTNYPFVRQSDGSWVTNAKMLEGNYFFTFPFAAYNGNREAIHSIGEQVQDGTSTASLQEAYAKNQFFIGYARIHAGTEGGDVMSADLEMTPVLGAVAVRIKNVGNQDFTVKKIVLQSKAFNTLVKVNPTMAEYKGEDEGGSYNLAYDDPNPNWSSDVKYFNYANYEEDYNADFTERFADPSDIYTLGGLVNNTQKSVNYNRKNALRAVINGIEKDHNGPQNLINGADDRAELTVLNAPVQKGNNPGVMENFIIMTNIYDYEDTPQEINAYIYTDRGMVGPVQISNINGEVNDNNGVTVISENPIVKIAPDEQNLVTLEIDDNSIQADVEMSVYNESDLLQLIEWNNASNIRRVYKAALQNDVTLTKEMSDLLTKSGVNSKLYINTNGNKLVIAEDAAANILDYVLVSNGELGKTQSAATIVVENNLTLGSKSFVNGSYSVGNIYTSRIELKNELEVAEGASLTVASPITYETTGDYQNQELIIVENEGTVTINANAEVEHLQIAENKADVTINANVTFVADSKNMENATITIGKGAIVSAGTPTQSYLTNEGKNDYTEDEDADWAVIYNNGQINNLVNAQYGKVIAGQGSTTNANSNAGEIDKSADIKAVVAVNNDNKGVISYTVKSKMALKDIIDSKITKLVIDGGSVEGTAWYNGVPATSYTASDVKWIEIKGQGGSLGTEIVNGATPSHCTSIFDNVVEITTSANATLADINFSDASIEFNIEAATTNIRGTVNAEGADVVIGSYDGRNYKGIDATLNIPATDGELFVKSINKTSDHADEVTAKVINQGYIGTAWDYTLDNTVVWEGAGTVNGNKPETPEMPVDDVTVSGTNGLKALADVVMDEETVITLNGNFDMSLDENKDYAYLLAGKDVIAGSCVIQNLTPDMNLSMKSLKAVYNNVVIMGNEKQPNVVVLTVDELDYSEAVVAITNGWVRVSGTHEVGSSQGVISGPTTNLPNPTNVITYDKEGNRLRWSYSAKSWMRAN